jgi:trehalose-6-phosphate synthase
MHPDERRARMSRMRTYVREHNIYRWAGSLIAELAAIRVDGRVQGGGEVESPVNVLAAVR